MKTTCLKCGQETRPDELDVNYECLGCQRAFREIMMEKVNRPAGLNIGKKRLTKSP